MYVVRMRPTLRHFGAFFFGLVLISPTASFPDLHCTVIDGAIVDTCTIDVVDEDLQTKNVLEDIRLEYEDYPMKCREGNLQHTFYLISHSTNTRITSGGSRGSRDAPPAIMTIFSG